METSRNRVAGIEESSDPAHAQGRRPRSLVLLRGFGRLGRPARLPERTGGRSPRVQPAASVTSRRDFGPWPSTRATPGGATAARARTRRPTWPTTSPAGSRRSESPGHTWSGSRWADWWLRSWRCGIRKLVKSLVLVSTHAGADAWRKAVIDSWVVLRQQLEIGEFTRAVLPWLVAPAFYRKQARSRADPVRRAKPLAAGSRGVRPPGAAAMSHDSARPDRAGSGAEPGAGRRARPGQPAPRGRRARRADCLERGLVVLPGVGHMPHVEDQAELPARDRAVPGATEMPDVREVTALLVAIREKTQMRLPRASGVLLHPTSLPGRYGIGDLGPRPHAFVDFLAPTGQRWWQILPLGPTGYGNSPYQSHSSFAGNPLLIDLDDLVEARMARCRGMPRRPALAGRPGRLRRRRRLQGRRAARGLRGIQTRGDDPHFEEFVAANRVWLDDYVLYQALKDAHGGLPWYRVGARAGRPRAIRLRAVARAAGRRNPLSPVRAVSSSSSSGRHCGRRAARKG